MIFTKHLWITMQIECYIESVFYPRVVINISRKQNPILSGKIHTKTKMNKYTTQTNKQKNAEKILNKKKSLFLKELSRKKLTFFWCACFKNIIHYNVYSVKEEKKIWIDVGGKMSVLICFTPFSRKWYRKIQYKYWNETKTFNIDRVFF